MAVVLKLLIYIQIFVINKEISTTVPMLNIILKKMGDCQWGIITGLQEYAGVLFLYIIGDFDIICAKGQHIQHQILPIIYMHIHMLDKEVYLVRYLEAYLSFSALWRHVMLKLFKEVFTFCVTSIHHDIFSRGSKGFV